jgi:hypothetical protein
LKKDNKKSIRKYFERWSIVIKPGPARRVNPGTGPVRVAQKTGECKKPVRPGQPGQTRVRPGIYIHLIFTHRKSRSSRRTFNSALIFFRAEEEISWLRWIFITSESIQRHHWWIDPIQLLQAENIVIKVNISLSLSRSPLSLGLVTISWWFYYWLLLSCFS